MAELCCHVVSCCHMRACMCASAPRGQCRRPPSGACTPHHSPPQSFGTKRLSKLEQEQAAAKAAAEWQPKAAVSVAADASSRRASQQGGPSLAEVRRWWIVRGTLVRQLLLSCTDYSLCPHCCPRPCPRTRTVLWHQEAEQAGARKNGSQGCGCGGSGGRRCAWPGGGPAGPSCSLRRRRRRRQTRRARPLSYWRLPGRAPPAVVRPPRRSGRAAWGRTWGRRRAASWSRSATHGCRR